MGERRRKNRTQQRGIIIIAPPGDIIPRSWKAKVAKYKIKLCPNGWFGGEIKWRGETHPFQGRWRIKWITTCNDDQYPVLAPYKVPCRCLALIVDGTCEEYNVLIVGILECQKAVIHIPDQT